ncbi:MAG: hypothetical protein KGZ79_07460 [Dethiobacter sp.]|jgi:hypothetical protein|nr:hypothetical protein [Dethiobacter sp.]
MKKLLLLLLVLIMVFIPAIAAAQTGSETTTEENQVVEQTEGSEEGQSEGDEDSDTAEEEEGDSEDSADEEGDTEEEAEADTEDEDEADTDADTEDDEEENEEEASATGLTPDSPFYFIKLFFEKIQVMFTFTSEGKAEKLLQQAETRLAELAALPEEKQALYAEKLAKAFLKAMEKVDKLLAESEEPDQEEGDEEEDSNIEEDGNIEEDEEEDEDDGDVADASLQSHPSLMALQAAWEKVPEQARPALEKAMVVSQTGKIRSLQVKEAKLNGEKAGPNQNAPGRAKEASQEVEEKVEEEVEELLGEDDEDEEES